MASLTPLLSPLLLPWLTRAVRYQLFDIALRHDPSQRHRDIALRYIAYHFARYRMLTSHYRHRIIDIELSISQYRYRKTLEARQLSSWHEERLEGGRSKFTAHWIVILKRQSLNARAVIDRQLASCSWNCFLRAGLTYFTLLRICDVIWPRIIACIGRIESLS